MLSILCNLGVDKYETSGVAKIISHTYIYIHDSQIPFTPNITGFTDMSSHNSVHAVIGSNVQVSKL